ncbi:glycerol-3-phosphate 1-O-acyltransferase PlsY [Thermodesulfobacteriota bacterium]
MTGFFMILIPLFTYLAGSIPFGSIIGRIAAGTDITKRGSGNIGATNVARELGIKWGLITLFLDMFKGFLPVFMVVSFYNPPGGWLLITVPISLLLGHRFSPFLNFKGGKGVATALGIFFALSPVVVLILLAVFILIVYVTDYVSLGSITASCMMPVILFFTEKNRDLLITASCIAAIICITHKDNIIRLIKGKERRWKNRKSGKDIE